LFTFSVRRFVKLRRHVLRMSKWLESGRITNVTEDDLPYGCGILCR
jgi:hypothetical protein